ncbi:MAG: cytochrome c3 family protein [Chloroflexaceae bacterium]|nr:cytochrome c3 family protein [Chloroflexaceae bacterium]NJL34370.1 cytochrome c3 family protein [Chloroflexaceae bacterium]NJO04499.1 cytochrome c3 family protein [Chloroflexaceae bacterium]
MKQFFRPSANLFAVISIFVSLYAVAGIFWGLAILDRANWTRRVNLPVEQPIPFSHQLHAGSLGMDCRYCHASAAISPYGNIPPSDTCVTCHHEIKRNSALLAPLWESVNNDTPIPWVKVHDLADFAYFNHSVHLTAGMGCTNCHGQVNEMPVVWKVHDMTMGWCLDCHRNPEKNIRPREEVWNMEYEFPPPAQQAVLGAQLVNEYGIDKSVLANCSICHR